MSLKQTLFLVLRMSTYGRFSCTSVITVSTFSKSSLSGMYPSSCCSVTLISTGSGGCKSVGDNTSAEKKQKITCTLIKVLLTLEYQAGNISHVSYGTKQSTKLLPVFEYHVPLKCQGTTPSDRCPSQDTL